MALCIWYIIKINWVLHQARFSRHPVQDVKKSIGIMWHTLAKLSSGRKKNDSGLHLVN